ncbi:GNAT family N-acetyltransferase [Aquimarina sp. MAR_2010_214]|uniref:GNAT family N-acetyltransferase n=1 Tax=Aquimarina sp. MAR_2010_214 TaxID=1250026 RepID=UPI0013046F83|nr:GNAT family N-acetyltransferase [Aquimarina sp. MAR_2010_214]
MKKIYVRKATPKDIEWINNTYQSIDFVVSDFNAEYIAIAKIEGVKCGLGRVVNIDKNNLELGGMYVLDQFRGMGIAEKIILHLLKNYEQHKKIWCLPFEHLQPFYNRFGFLDQKTHDYKIPDKIYAKHKWCNQNYNKDVLLLVK